ncbi:MAG TPA: hypothetical protein VMM83_01130 [Longimicrobiales bacterium]|nr:hypothetical protein [Longimicrobiales bacterium]
MMTPSLDSTRSAVPPAASFRSLALAVAVAAAGACGGGDPDADAGGATPGRDTAADTATGTVSPSSAPGAGGEPGGEPDPGPWSDPPIRRVPEGSQTGAALLRSVRTGGHDGYDRIVFEFEDHLPEYTIRYLQDPTACGSGERVDAGAAVALEIDLRPAAAHDNEGRPTIAERVRAPRLPALETARITCDFEAIVTWVLGLDRRTPVRVLELASPSRLVVDVPHR